MKKFILAISIVCLLAPLSIAQAQPTITRVGDLVTKEEERICEEVYKVSAAIMTYRQSGMSIINIRKQARQFKTSINNHYLTKMAVGAYDVPRFFNQEKIDYAIGEYANTHYRAAYKLAEETDITYLIGGK